MTLHDFDCKETTERISVDQFSQWIQQQPASTHQYLELLEGKIHSSPHCPKKMRMLRLLQRQLQHFLSTKPTEEEQSKIAKHCTFEAQLRPHIQLDEFNRLTPAIAIRTSCGKTVNPKSHHFSAITWIIDIEQDAANQKRVELYAQAGIPNYWSLDLDSVELHAYQQPSCSGYIGHRVLQVGDCASPTTVPLTVRLQEPIPLHFMTRTLNGQQTYQSYALPFFFSHRAA